MRRSIVQLTRVECLLVCVLGTAIIGCANPNQMRQRAPDLELKSERPAKSLAICIADKWENGSSIGGTYPITIRPLENGFTVSITTYPTLFADVIEMPTGSVVKFFRDAVSPGFEDDIVKCAASK
jgi:hypothetical protein